MHSNEGMLGVAWFGSNGNIGMKFRIILHCASQQLPFGWGGADANVWLTDWSSSRP